MRKFVYCTLLAAFFSTVFSDFASAQSVAQNRARSARKSTNPVRTEPKFRPLEVPAALPGAERLDLQATLKRALEKSPTYNIAFKQSENSELRRKNAWSLLLPSADLNATHDNNRLGVGNPYYEQPNLQPWSNQLGLSITERLTDTFENYRVAKIADIEREQAKLTLDRERNQLLVSVAKAYYDYSEAAGKYELGTSQLETQRELFKLMESRYFQGLNSSRDYLRIKAETQRSEVEQLNALYRVNETRESLKNVVGDAGNLEFIPYDSRGIKPETITFANPVAENTLDFRIANAYQEAAKVRVSSAKFAYWPRIGIEAGVDLNQPNYLESSSAPENERYYNLRARVTIEFNLWDWGIRRRNIEVANNEQSVFVSEQERKRLDVIQALNNLNTSKVTLLKTFKLSAQILSASEDVYVSVSRAYREGKVNYIDLITVLGELYGSRTQNLSLRYNILKTQADLAFYEGNVDEALKAQ